MKDAGKEWALEVEDLTVAYADQPVLWDVDLQVPAGVKMAIIGPNGAGKSTLVKAAMGLVRPVAGEVRIFGQPRASAQGQIAYVPQRATLSWDFPTDVLDVVTMGTYGRLGWFHRSGAVQRQQAEAALEQVGMNPLDGDGLGETADSHHLCPKDVGHSPGGDLVDQNVLSESFHDHGHPV